MQKFRNLSASRLALYVGGLVLALGLIWPLTGSAQVKPKKDKNPVAQTQHKDKQLGPDKDLASQVAELGAKVARLEAALKKSQASGMNGMGAMKPPMAVVEDDMDEMRAMPPADVAAMGGGEMEMKMDKMLGMMEKMMAGAAMQRADGMARSGSDIGMKMDKMMGMMEKMLSRGAMQPAGGAAAMGGGGMGMKMDKMMGMMEKMMGGGAMQPAQAPPAMPAMPDM